MSLETGGVNWKASASRGDISILKRGLNASRDSIGTHKRFIWIQRRA